MDPKLKNLIHDLDDCRNSGVCRTCLVDVLTTTLHEVLEEIGPRETGEQPMAMAH